MHLAKAKFGYWINSLWNVGSTVSASGISFLFTLTFMHGLGFRTYGAYVYTQSFVQLSMLPLTAIWSGVTNLIISDGYSSRGIAKPMLYFVTIYSVLVSLIYESVTGFHWVYLFIMVLYACGLYFVSALQMLLNAEGRFRVSGIIQLFVAIGQFGGLLFVLFVAHRSTGIVLMLMGFVTLSMGIAGSIFAGASSYWSGQINIKEYLLRSVRVTSAYFWVNLSDALMFSGSRLLFGHTFNLGSLAVYDLAMRFVTLTRMLVVSAFGTLLPYLSMIQRTSNRDTILRIYRGLCALATSGSSLVFSLLVFLGPWIRNTIISSNVALDDWMSLLIVLAIGISFHTTTVVQSSMMLSKGNTTGIYAMEITSLSIFVLVYLFLKHTDPKIAVAAAVGVAMGLSSIVYSFVVDRKVGVKPIRNIMLMLATHVGIILYILSRLTNDQWGILSYWGLSAVLLYVLIVIFAGLSGATIMQRKVPV